MLRNNNNFLLNIYFLYLTIVIYSKKELYEKFIQELHILKGKMYANHLHHLKH